MSVTDARAGGWPASPSDRPSQLRPPQLRAPLLVVQVGPPESLERGPAVHRTLQPCRALGELARPDGGERLSRSPRQLYSQGLLLAADVLVLRGVADPDLLPIISARRRQGRLTAYEIDGQVFASTQARVGPTLPPRPGRTDLVTRNLVPQLGPAGQPALQLATRGAGTRFAPLSPRRAVFPSPPWEVPAPPAPREPTDRAVIEQAGTAERNDLALTLPALGRCARPPPGGAEWPILGDPELGDLLRSCQACASRRSLPPAGSDSATQRFKGGLDIGLAPLAPTAPQPQSAKDLALHRLRRPPRARGVRRSRALPRRGPTQTDQVPVPGRGRGTETVLEQVLAEPELRATASGTPGRGLRQSNGSNVQQVAERLEFYLSTAARVGLQLGDQPRTAPAVSAARAARHRTRRAGL